MKWGSRDSGLRTGGGLGWLKPQRGKYSIPGKMVIKIEIDGRLCLLCFNEYVTLKWRELGNIYMGWCIPTVGQI